LTNFNSSAATQSVFQALQKQGILLSSYHSLGHPSEPNYLASVYGDRFGLGDDDYSYVPQNMTNVFDLLDTKFISWGCYQENLPFDGDQEFSYSQPSYLPGASATNYTYYVSSIYISKEKSCPTLLFLLSGPKAQSLCLSH
jgi:hypothetical protein